MSISRRSRAYPQDVLGADVAQGNRSNRDDPEPSVALADLEELAQEMGLFGMLGAVVEIDLRAARFEMPRHAQERSDTDATGDPDLAWIAHLEIRKAPIWSFDLTLAPGLILIKSVV